MKKWGGILLIVIGFALIAYFSFLRFSGLNFSIFLILTIIAFIILSSGFYLVRPERYGKSAQIKNNKKEVKKILDEPLKEFKNEDHDRFMPK